MRTLEEQSEVDSEQPWFRAFNGSDLVGMAVVAVIILLAFFDVVFLGKTFSTASGTVGVNGFDPPTGYSGSTTTLFRPDPGASAWQFEPWAEVTNRILREKEVPLWNPYKGFGAPHAANMQSAVFDPLLLLVNLRPTQLTWDIAFLMAFFMGALSMYLLCRLLGLGMPASITGATGFILSGFFILYSNEQFFRSYTYLPVLFILVELSLVTRRWVLPVVGLALAIAGTILMGMPEASFLILSATTLYAAYRIYGRLKILRLRIALGRLAVSGLLGLSLASPLLLPFSQYDKNGYTVHSPTEQVGSRADQKLGLAYWLIPYLNGPSPQSFVDAGAGIRSWTGIALAILVLVGISSPSAMRKHGAWFFAGLGAVLLVKSYDFSWIQWLGRLPLAQKVNFPQFAAPIAGFCFAFVGAVGVQSLSKGQFKKSRFAAVGVFFIAGTVWLLAKNHLVLSAAMKPLELVFLPGHIVIRPLLFTGGLAAAAAAATGVILFMPSKRASILAASVVCLELLLLAPHGTYLNRFDPFATPPWMKMVSQGARDEPYSRVYGVDAKLFPDTAGAMGLYDIRSIDAIYPNRYVQYIRAFVEPEFYSRFVGGPFGQPHEQSLADIQENKMFDLLGVRYILTGGSDNAIQESFRTVGSAGGVRVFENPDRLPRAFLVHKVHVVRNVDEALDLLKSAGSSFPDGAIRVERFDPSKEAVVEAPDIQAVENKINGDLDAGKPGSLDTVSFVSYTANEVKIKVHTSRSALLLLTDTFFPGWEATANNKSVEILPTDVAFRGVPIGPGDSTVVFNYRPVPFRTGISLAALAALIMVCMLLGERVIQRATTKRSSTVSSVERAL